MNKIATKLKTKNIQDLYNIQSVTENGQINLKGTNVIIYKIEPANIVACDEETKHKIYQAYLTCIRGLPDTFQIVISRDVANFDKQIRECEKRIKEIESEKLKLAIQKYMEYLREISGTNKLYKSNHYLMIENLKKDEMGDINNIFSNLQEFGVGISQVTSKQQVQNILKRYMSKE